MAATDESALRAFLKEKPDATAAQVAKRFGIAERTAAHKMRSIGKAPAKSPKKAEPKQASTKKSTPAKATRAGTVKKATSTEGATWPPKKAPGASKDVPVRLKGTPGAPTGRKQSKPAPATKKSSGRRRAAGEGSAELVDDKFFADLRDKVAGRSPAKKATKATKKVTKKKA